MGQEKRIQLGASQLRWTVFSNPIKPDYKNSLL